MDRKWWKVGALNAGHWATSIEVKVYPELLNDDFKGLGFHLFATGRGTNGLLYILTYCKHILI